MVRWSQPPVLLLLVAAAGLVGLVAWSERRRRALYTSLSDQSVPSAPQPSGKSWIGLTVLAAAWVALVVGAAGPQWGVSSEGGVAVGRDVVLILDLSRSMHAEDMADSTLRRRWQAARQGALDVVAAAAERGGHRLGVIVFAARPVILSPLTTDYAYLQQVLEEVDGQYPPPEVRPPPAEQRSGTRIGRALEVAVALHDQRFPGYQDIILFSDGDDPGGDQEWRRGITAARTAAIPVHTVGLGCPDPPAVLTLGGQFVQTQLDEEVLQTIAAQTHGRYIAARQALPPMAAFFRDYLEPLPRRLVSDEALPVYQHRYVWFLAPALVLFAGLWWRGR